jgi:protein disulfide-isomerase A1
LYTSNQSSRQSLPAVTQITSANVEDFKKADKVVAVAYVSSTSDALSAVFTQVAEAHRDDYLFGSSFWFIL